jgi:hypothetical protein
LGRSTPWQATTTSIQKDKIIGKKGGKSRAKKERKPIKINLFHVKCWAIFPFYFMVICFLSKIK